jgi:hypothetical protein
VPYLKKDLRLVSSSSRSSRRRRPRLPSSAAAADLVCPAAPLIYFNTTAGSHRLRVAALSDLVSSEQHCRPQLVLSKLNHDPGEAEADGKRDRGAGPDLDKLRGRWRLAYSRTSSSAAGAVEVEPSPRRRRCTQLLAIQLSSSISCLSTPASSPLALPAIGTVFSYTQILGLVLGTVLPCVFLTVCVCVYLKN